MARKNWKQLRAVSLQDAINLSIEYARAHNVSIEQIADIMQLSNKFTLYKWIESGRIPLSALRSFESACKCPYVYVTRYLASSINHLLIPIPNGRGVSDKDTNTLQAVLTDAVSALISFAAHKSDAQSTLAAINNGLEALAFQHGQVSKHAQPEFEFDDGDLA